MYITILLYALKLQKKIYIGFYIYFYMLKISINNFFLNFCAILVADNFFRFFFLWNEEIPQLKKKKQISQY